MPNKQTLSLQFDILYLGKKCLFEDNDRYFQCIRGFAVSSCHNVHFICAIHIVTQSIIIIIPLLLNQHPAHDGPVHAIIYDLSAECSPPPLPNTTHISITIDRWIILISRMDGLVRVGFIQQNTATHLHYRILKFNVNRPPPPRSGHKHTSFSRVAAGGRQI